MYSRRPEHIGTGPLQFRMVEEINASTRNQVNQAGPFSQAKFDKVKLEMVQLRDRHTSGYSVEEQTIHKVLLDQHTAWMETRYGSSTVASGEAQIQGPDPENSKTAIDIAPTTGTTAATTTAPDNSGSS